MSDKIDFSAKTNAKWSKLENSSNLTKAYKITIPYQTFTNWANENRESKAVKGFRPGHAPLSYFKDDWMLAAARLIAEDIIKDEKYEAIFDVKYILETFELGQEVKFTLNIELYPEVPKIELENINLTKHIAQITNADIKKAIEQFASTHFKPAALRAPRKTQMGDFLNVSVEIEDKNGRKEKMNDMNIQLGKKTFLPEIEEKLVGLNLNDTLTHNFEIPATGTLLRDQNLIGQTINITFKINQIQDAVHFEQKDLLEYFCVLTEGELEKKFQAQMQAEAEKYSNHLLKENLKQELLKYYFEIPINMLQEKYRALRQQVLTDLGYKEDMDLATVIKEKMNLTLEEFENRTIFIAEAMARINFLFMHYGRELNISANQAELDDLIAAQKHMFPNGLNDAVRFFEENPEAKNNLRNQLSEEKIAHALIAKCKINEKEHDLAEFYQINLNNNLEENAQENKIAEVKKPKSKTNIAASKKENV